MHKNVDLQCKFAIIILFMRCITLCEYKGQKGIHIIMLCYSGDAIGPICNYRALLTIIRTQEYFILIFGLIFCGYNSFISPEFKYKILKEKREKGQRIKSRNLKNGICTPPL